MSLNKKFRTCRFHVMTKGKPCMFNLALSPQRSCKAHAGPIRFRWELFPGTPCKFIDPCSQLFSDCPSHGSPIWFLWELLLACQPTRTVADSVPYAEVPKQPRTSVL